MSIPEGPFVIQKEIDGGLQFQTILGPDGMGLMTTCGDAMWSLRAVNLAWQAGYAAAMVAGEKK